MYNVVLYSSCVPGEARRINCGGQCSLARNCSGPFGRSALLCVFCLKQLFLNT